MSGIWKFSPSVIDQVQLCVAAARKDDQSKWYQEFGHLTRDQNLGENLYGKKVVQTSRAVEICSQNNDLSDSKEVKMLSSKETTEIDAEYIEEMIESLETEFSIRVDIIVEECVNNNDLLHTLALKLSSYTVEKLCKHICGENDTNKKFVTKYFEYFLPTYIKRCYNASTLDIIMKSHKRFPCDSKLLLQKLIKDPEIPKQVLQSFLEAFNEDDRSSFIVNLSEFDMSSQEFANCISTIFSAYKDCKKSEQVQIYLQQLLVQHSSFCVTDRNFGRLLLTFLQTQKDLKMPINNINIENIVETHRSPFKRPCALLLKELVGELDVIKSLSDSDSDE